LRTRSDSGSDIDYGAFNNAEIDSEVQDSDTASSK
jgi:hypothetical protein